MIAVGVTGRDDQLALTICARIANDPQFWPAVSSLARRNLETFERMNPSQKWFVSDLGRTALSLAAGVLHAEPGGMTLSALYRFARLNDVCSAGRVLTFYNTAAAKKCFVPQACGGPRAGEVTHLSQSFQDILRAYLRNMLRTLRRLDVIDGRAIDWIDQPGSLRDLLAALRLAAVLVPEPVVTAETPLGQLLSLQGGPQILDALLADAPGDARVLPFPAHSRQQLATRCAVSRTQVSRILGSAAARGHLRLAPESICMGEALRSDLIRAYSAGLGAVTLALLMCGQPVGAP